MQIVTTITYNIWSARNIKNFQNRDVPAAEAIDKALKMLHDYHMNISEDRIQRTQASEQLSERRNNKSWSSLLRTI
jgi:hypothetical protein